MVTEKICSTEADFTNLATCLFTHYEVKFKSHLDNEVDDQLHSELMSIQSHLSITLQQDRNLQFMWGSFRSFSI